MIGSLLFGYMIILLRFRGLGCYVIFGFICVGYRLSDCRFDVNRSDILCSLLLFTTRIVLVCLGV